MRTMTLSLAIGLLIAGAAWAADCAAPATCEKPACCDPCARCGCDNMVCKLVCEKQKIKKVVWVVECQYICPALPGCGHACSTCCDSCGGESCDGSCCDSCKCDPCASLRKPLVPPRCVKPCLVKKLVKKEITCEVPAYKCVAVCCGCGNCCVDPGCCEASGGAPAGEKAGQQETAPAPPAPPAPKEASTDAAPLPPIVGASFAQPVRSR